MARITATADNINPTDIYAYLDKVQVWLKQPLPRQQLKWLRQQCGHLHIKNQNSRFNRDLHQRLQLHQPSPEAIQSLNTVADHYLNYAEMSLDWVFPNEQERDEAYEFICRYHVKKWHGKQEVKFVGEGGVTRYSGPRKAPNILAIYKDKPSKMTGEVDCVHFDWRIRGHALSRQGIKTLTDLNVFDHRQFWEKRLLLYRIKARELGRQYRYRVEGKERREWVLFSRNGKFAYDIDRRIGDIIIRAALSTQKVIDRYQRLLNVRNYLEPISVRHLLPGNQRSLLAGEGVTELKTTLAA